MSSQSLESKPPLKISAKKRSSKLTLARVCQADIFKNIRVTESAEVIGDSVVIHHLDFPYVACMNQECDLEQDQNLRKEPGNKTTMLHYAVAPAFSFENFLTGKHWGEISGIQCTTHKRADTIAKKIMDNEIPRYHYLRFQEADMPELIIDFKQFFTVSAELLISNLGNRLCSMEDLFREQLSHRFSYYIARVGLPVAE